jgi:hypothetical protein
LEHPVWEADTETFANGVDFDPAGVRCHNRDKRFKLFDWDFLWHAGIYMS